MVITIKKEFEFEFDYDDFYDFCADTYFKFEETVLLIDNVINKYFKEYCKDYNWCDDYESEAFMANKEKIIPEIQSIIIKNLEIEQED